MVRIEAVATGAITPALALWMANYLPRKELSKDENMKRTQCLVTASLAGVGIAFFAGIAAKKIPEEWQELRLPNLAPAGI